MPLTNIYLYLSTVQQVFFPRKARISTYYFSKLLFIKDHKVLLYSICTACFKYRMCYTPVLHLLILTSTLRMIHSPITPVSLITCTFPLQLMQHMYSSTELYPQSCLLEPRLLLVQLSIFCKWRICDFNDVSSSITFVPSQNH